MLNRCMIIGHLGRDVELRYSQNGSAVASLNIATDESYTDRDGNKVECVEWHRVSVYGKSAENCANEKPVPSPVNLLYGTTVSFRPPVSRTIGRVP